MSGKWYSGGEYYADEHYDDDDYAPEWDRRDEEYTPDWNSHEFQGTHKSYGRHYDRSHNSLHNDDDDDDDYVRDRGHDHDDSVRPNSFPQTADPSPIKHRYTCGTSTTVTFGYEDDDDFHASEIGGGSSRHDKYRTALEGRDKRAPFDSPFAQETWDYHKLAKTSKADRAKWWEHDASQKQDSCDHNKGLAYAHTAAISTRREIDARQNFMESYIGYDDKPKGHYKRVHILKGKEAEMLARKHEHQDALGDEEDRHHEHRDSLWDEEDRPRDHHDSLYNEWDSS